MNALRILVPSLLLTLITLLGCAPARQDMLVASIGNNDITLGDYEKLFLKTSADRDSAQATTVDERKDFLDLLVNFRLKLLDAYDEGLDHRPETESEINLYRGSLATSYLIDREVMTPGIRNLYNQRLTEYRASHILLDGPASEDPADSAEAYQKAYELIHRLAAGEDFAALAAEYSKDPGTKDIGGDLYYFTAGQMVRPFEEAVMSMQIGEVTSKPVRTQFGLHIIKLVDRKPSPGEIRCSHIMTRFQTQDPSPEDTAAAYEGIRAVLDSLNQGVDFAELARRNSADPGSAPNGGDLGWFARRRWPAEFDEEAFKLSPGQTSGIVRSRFGYHIIKCTDARPPKSFEEASEEVRKLYEDTRFKEDKTRFLEKLKVETGFHLNEDVLSAFISEIDTMKPMKDLRWADSLSSEVRNSTLMRFADRTISVDSTIKLLRKRPDLNNTYLRPAIFRNSIDKVAEQAIFTVKAESLEKSDPEFASLMKEYMDGILLYQIEQDRVWNRVAVEDSAVMEFFDANRDRFRYPERVRFKEIRASTAQTARLFHEKAAEGETFEEIAAQDSARMARPNSFKLTFSGGSTKFSKETGLSITRVGEDLASDAQVRVNLVAHPDTAGGNTKNTEVANKRLERIKGVLVSEHGIVESRIRTFVRPVGGAVANSATDNSRKILNNQIDADLIGRRPNIVGKVETLISPVDEDERSKQAALLDAGSISEPFRYKNGFSVVKSLGTEPARQKTFEEAGTEVSSAFQEYESKRLEAEWLDGLKMKYPVVEHPEILGQAFIPSE